MFRRLVTGCAAAWLIGSALSSGAVPILAPPSSVLPVAHQEPVDQVLPEIEVLQPPAAPASAEEKLAALEQQVAALGKGLEEAGKNITVVTGKEDFKIVLGGAITADFLFNKARPVAPGTPFFLTPGSVLGFDQDTFDANARQTSLVALIAGPEVCGFQSGGLIVANFYNDAVIVDRYGLLPIQAFGQLKDDHWRFAAGLQIDIFNAPFPTVLPFSLLLAQGNTGAYRGQARVERYVYPTGLSQVTVIAGISEPVPTTISNNFDSISEDNGWPNLETRVVLGLGAEEGQGLLGRRPIEIAVSGVVGQLRTTQILNQVVIADVWGLGADLRWQVSERFGVQGEVFVGQALGTYGGGILQNVNAVNFNAVQAAGGFLELYYYLCPDKLHTHFGYGIDDPIDDDLALGQPVRNETYFANLLWDVTKAFRVAGELAYRKTAYTLFPNNEGLGFQAQVQWKF